LTLHKKGVGAHAVELTLADVFAVVGSHTSSLVN
jgi:hypothetical protein